MGRHDRFMPCRVLLVDDNPDFRTAARQLLERNGFAVVAEAETGVSGIERAQEHRPDLVLLDVQLPDIDGFEVAERLSRLEVPVDVILTSSLDGTDFGTLVAGSSALGFLPKPRRLPRAGSRWQRARPTPSRRSCATR
jgi:CheY-like chemotaxis protein